MRHTSSNGPMVFLQPSSVSGGRVTMMLKISIYHKSSLRHTVGLRYVAWPCGVIPDFGEIYGAESISQVFLTRPGTR